MNRLRLLAAGLLVLLRAFAADFDHTHAALTRVLAATVTNGVVDYAALQASPAGLDAYLAALAAVPEERFKAWTRPQRLAFLLNLYNAATLKLVADHHPVASIRRIGSLLKGPWKQDVVHAWGRVLTLDALEHRTIRPDFGEPRIHFALVCAARSCPPLRGEAYAADRLEAQLDDQARTFLAQPAKNRLDRERRTLWLSPIFDWYAADFTVGGKTVAQFVAPFLPDADAVLVNAGGLAVKFTDYDWSLNGR